MPNINVSTDGTSGNKTLVAGVTGKVITVLGFALQGDADGVCTLGDGTTVHASVRTKDGGGQVVPVDINSSKSGALSAGLVLNVSTASHVYGFVEYTLR